jgi:leader peptidase (prepilin peptidase) / N-methyltransferase
MPIAALVAAVFGAVFGVASDRLAARWPAHEDGRVRPVDWRTIVVAVAGALAFGGLALRWSEPRDLVILGAWFSVLLVLLATDLDQRLLPDVLTLPLIPITLVILLVGLDPLLAGKQFGLASGVAAAIGAPVLLFLTDLVLRGSLGMGDLKLAVSLGLMSGVTLLFAGFLVASAASSLVLVALLATRRIGLRSAIPFGPILIVGAFIAALLPGT